MGDYEVNHHPFVGDAQGMCINCTYQKADHNPNWTPHDDIGQGL